MGGVLAVIGPRKSGKSSLINALIGRNLLATGQLMGVACNIVRRGTCLSYTTCGAKGEVGVDRRSYLKWAGSEGKIPGAYAKISCPFPRSMRKDVLIETFWGSTIQPEEIYEAETFVIVAHPFGLAAEDIRTSALFFDNILASREAVDFRVYLTGRFGAETSSKRENAQFNLLADTISIAIGVPCRIIKYGGLLPCK